MKQCIEVILIKGQWIKCRRLGITQLIKDMYLCAECATKHKHKHTMMGTVEFQSQILNEEIGNHSIVPSIKQLEHYLMQKANARERRKSYNVDYLSDS